MAPVISRALVVINEFGASSIDHDLVETSNESVVALPSSCVCCAVRNDVVTTLLEQRGRRCKGLISVEAERGTVSVQSAQHVLYPPFALQKWSSDDKSTRLVLITRGLSESSHNALEDEARTTLQAQPRKHLIDSCASERGHCCS